MSASTHFLHVHYIEKEGDKERHEIKKLIRFPDNQLYTQTRSYDNINTSTLLPPDHAAGKFAETARGLQGKFSKEGQAFYNEFVAPYAPLESKAAEPVVTIPVQPPKQTLGAPEPPVEIKIETPMVKSDAPVIVSPPIALSGVGGETIPVVLGTQKAPVIMATPEANLSGSSPMPAIPVAPLAVPAETPVVKLASNQVLEMPLNEVQLKSGESVLLPTTPMLDPNSKVVAMPSIPVMTEKGEVVAIPTTPAVSPSGELVAVPTTLITTPDGFAATPTVKIAEGYSVIRDENYVYKAAKFAQGPRAMSFTPTGHTGGKTYSQFSLQHSKGDYKRPEMYSYDLGYQTTPDAGSRYVGNFYY